MHHNQYSEKTQYNTSLVLVHSWNEQKMISSKSQELKVFDPKLLCITSQLRI